MDRDAPNATRTVIPESPARWALLVVLLLVAVGGLAAVTIHSPGVRPGGSPADGSPPASGDNGSSYDAGDGPLLDLGDDGPPDPDEDVIGWENGYWYNESIAVDQSDGLSETERRAFVARSMARVEHLRRLEFTQDVTVETVPRSELLAVAANTTAYDDATFGAPTSEQLWEALFLVDEPANAPRAIRQRNAAVVLGYAAEEGADHVFIVTDGSADPAIGSVTLIHELVHVLQDQHFDLSRQQYRPDTLDGEFGKDGLVEGGATYVHKLYQRKCGDEWGCVDTPAGWSATGSAGHRGLSRLFFQPYSDGPVFVHRLVQRGGWPAVNAAYESPPVSSEQIIHPERPNESLAPLSFENAARNGWTPVERRGESPQRVGEVGTFTLFWYQAHLHDAPALERQIGAGTDGPFDTYNYTSVPSAGWGNDRLVAYEKGEKCGYVWKTEWDTRADAVEFADAYRQVLSANDAVQRGDRTWVIEDGGFADAFRVVRDGTTVTIVNGPTVRAVNDIRPGTKSAD